MEIGPGPRRSTPAAAAAAADTSLTQPGEFTNFLSQAGVWWTKLNDLQLDKIGRCK